MGYKSRVPVAAGAVFRNPACWLAFGFGVGLVPVAPGTFGTLLGIPLYWVLAGTTAPVYGAAVVGMTVIGVAVCGAAAKTLRVGDHPGIVWDEIVGFLIALWGVPFAWSNVVLGFLLFRFFDVVKPWPIAWVDRQVAGGLGIMADDMLAGVFAWAVLQLLGGWLSL